MISCIRSYNLLYWITWSFILDHMISCIGSHDQVSSENEPSGISSNIQTFRDIQEMLENPRLAEMQKFLLLQEKCCKVIIAPYHITHRPGGAHWLGVRSECNPYSRKLLRHWILSFLSKIWGRGTWQHQQAICERSPCESFPVCSICSARYTYCISESMSLSSRSMASVTSL